LEASLKAVGEAIPFQPWAEELYSERKGNFSKGDPEDHCMLPGARRIITAPYLFRVVQTPKLIVILYEDGSQAWRQIFMDGRQHPSTVIRLGSVTPSVTGKATRSWWTPSGLTGKPG
jgi:hypothetical protein